MSWSRAILLVLAVLDDGLSAERPAAQRPAAPTDTATITGAIVRMHDGGPVRFASVIAEAVDGTVRRTVTADSAGHFAISNLVPGRYGVRASSSGYVTGVWRPDTTGRQLRSLTLEPNQRQTGVRIALARGGVITGRVVDGDGAPVEGVPVHALAAEFRNGRELLRQATSRPRITDDRGNFRLFGLEPGDYYIAAIPGSFGDQPGGPLARHPLTYFPGTPSAAEAVATRVTADREFAIGDLVVQPAITTTISGMVVDSRGVPGASAELVLLPAAGPVSSVLPRATCDASGRFAFLNVPEGQYLLQNLPMPSASPEFGVISISVPGATAHVLRLQAGVSLRGKVTFADGVPDFELRRLVVGLQTATRGQSPLSRGARAKVLEDGTLELSNLWGSHFVRLPEPPRGWMLRHVYLGDEDFIDRPILFTREVTGALTIVLTRRGGTVVGTVHDGADVPAADSTVLIYSADTSRWFQDDRAIQWTRADGAGHYQSRGMPAGDYLVAAVENWTVRDWPPRAELLESLRGRARRITVREGRQHQTDVELAWLEPSQH